MLLLAPTDRAASAHQRQHPCWRAVRCQSTAAVVVMLLLRVTEAPAGQTRGERKWRRSAAEGGVASASWCAARHREITSARARARSSCLCPTAHCNTVEYDNRGYKNALGRVERVSADELL